MNKTSILGGNKNAESIEILESNINAAKYKERRKESRNCRAGISIWLLHFHRLYKPLRYIFMPNLKNLSKNGKMKTSLLLTG